MLESLNATDLNKVLPRRSERAAHQDVVAPEEESELFAIVEDDDTV